MCCVGAHSTHTGKSDDVNGEISRKKKKPQTDLCFLYGSAYAGVDYVCSLSGEYLSCTTDSTDAEYMTNARHAYSILHDSRCRIKGELHMHVQIGMFLLIARRDQNARAHVHIHACIHTYREIARNLSAC